MKPKTTVFCKSIGSYDGQLTKRKPYLIEEVKAENIRIRNDQDKLKWYDSFYFDLEKQAEIYSVHFDDEINDVLSALVEVTIEFSDNKKCWTSFTTPEYLKELLIGQSYISTQKLIIVSELTEETMKKAILELDSTDRLLESCNEY